MKYVLTLLIFFCGLLSTEAQIVDRSKDRAKDKANNRVDRKIDNGIDKGLDAIEGIFKKKDRSKKEDQEDAPASSGDDEMTEEDTMKMMNNLFGGGDIDMEDEYAFDKSVKMKIESFDSKGKMDSSQDMEMLFSDDNAQIGMLMGSEDGNGKIIMDMETKQMISLADTEGMKIAMAIDLTSSLESTHEVTEEQMEMYDAMKKTGRTKVILGYTCYEYVFDDEDNSYEFWMAEEDMLDMYSAFAALQSANPKKDGISASSYPDGMMMETTTISKKRGTKDVMRVTEINKNKSQTISTVGYESFGFQGGE